MSNVDLPPDLPAHVGQIGGGRMLLKRLRLDDQMTYESAWPNPTDKSETLTLIRIQGLWPETVMNAARGRRLDEMVRHPDIVPEMIIEAMKCWRGTTILGLRDAAIELR